MQVSPQAMSQIMRFLYTGAIQEQIINMAAIKQVPFAISTKSQKYLFLIFLSVSQKPCIALLLQAAEYLELSSLSRYLTNIINKDQYLNTQLEQSYLLVNMMCTVKAR